MGSIYMWHMGWFKVIFVLILVNRLDGVQSEGNETSEESITATYETLVEYTTTVFGTSPIKECFVRNFTVISEYNASPQYINLKMSWETIDEDYLTNLRIYPLENNNKNNCFFSADIFNHPVRNNTILKPGVPSEPEIEPGCIYGINITSDKRTNQKCAYTYTVPDCVGKKCDCEKYTPTSRILSVEHLSGNKFLVKWDPGQATVSSNRTYTIEDIYFKYRKKSSYDIHNFASAHGEKKDDTSKLLTMDLIEDQNYTLIAYITNNFSCRAVPSFDFTAPTNSDNNTFIILIILLALIMILLALTYKSIVKCKNRVKKRNVAGQEIISLGVERIPMMLNFQYTPVELMEGRFDKYEFPRHKVIIKEIIGSGAFGLVYSAKAIGIGGCEGYRMVAVKTLGEGEHINKEATNDFIAEIEIFKKIGRHPNIVALLGCCTLDTPYMMIMEFVPCGDLKNYLLELREKWLLKKSHEKSKQIFFPDTSDGAYIEPPSPTTPISVTSSRLPSTSETVSTILDEPMTPPLSEYSQTLNKDLDHNELQNFALQIARGMAHLEKIPITHRDLAARNILINEFKTLKISDFGLSRSGPYINYKTKKLPLRWMAIEAIVEQKYDSKSDVWSFGVVLWEIGTLGAFPYETVPDSFLLQFLQMGRRLERPEICTDELYAVMKQCWSTDPDNRPTFQELVDLLDVKKRKIYANFNQLNPTYVFPPSEVQKSVENPVRVVDITLENKPMSDT